MLALARRRLALFAAIIAVLMLVSCGGEDQPQTLGNVLPDDTLAWLHLDDLAALEGALESYGLMDLLVAELDKPETRADLEAELGLVLADDPRETVHALMQDLVRADVSAHAPLHPGAEDPVVVVHLECADEAAAGRVLDLMGKRAEGEVTLAGHTAMRIVAEDDLTLFLGRTGAHVVLCSEGETWGEIVGATIDPPPAALVDSEAYQRVVGSEASQMTAYITPEFQDELRGFGIPHAGINPAAMGPLADKYGSSYAYLTADYLLSRLLVRQALTPGSPLAPLYVCADGENELMSWLPAGTFFYEGWLVEDGRAKMQLVLELLNDSLDAVSEAAPGRMPATPEDPVAEVEGMLGFSLLDLAERVREVAVAGTASPGWLMMMRAHDETQAQEISDMVTGIPMLAMLGPGEPLTLGDTSLVAWGSPGGGGNLIAMGRHADTFLMVIQVADTADLEAFLEQVGSDGFLGSVPGHASGQLNHAGSGWGYFDLGGAAAAVKQDLDEQFEDLPPGLAQRLRELRAAGHMTMRPGGVSEMVMETGAP